MSRTDKDTPWWVNAKEWGAVHYQCDRRYDSPETLRLWNSYRGGRACDLPPEPRLNDWRSNGINGRRTGRRFCHWEPIWPYGHFPHHWPGPPHWYRRSIWKSPDRNRVRDSVAGFIKEYRAYGESDIVVPTQSHRRSAWWTWW